MIIRDPVRAARGHRTLFMPAAPPGSGPRRPRVSGVPGRDPAVRGPRGDGRGVTAPACPERHNMEAGRH